MDFFNTKSSVKILKNFGSDLVEFYRKVIIKEFDFRKAPNIKVLEHDIEHTSRTDTVFSTASRRCAYVFQHSPLISSLAAHHLLELFKIDPNKIDHLLNQGELKICCLGGGPGTDAVAVSKIVTAVHQASKLRKQLKLQFTIIDNEENWKITVQNVMEMLEQTQQFFDAKKINLSFKFFKADLTQTLTGESLFEICQADILTMFYLVSSIQEKATLPTMRGMIQRIFGNMKTGAFLLFIDVPVFPCYGMMTAAAKRCKDLCQVYGPYEHKLHLLPLDAVKRNLQLYSQYLGATLCSFHCVSTISAWCKGTELLQNLTSVTEEVSDLQEVENEAHQEENCTERNANRKKTDKRERMATTKKINIEGKAAAKGTEVLQNLTSVTEEKSDLQEVENEAHQEENRTERNTNRKKTDKPAAVATTKKIGLEGKAAAQPIMNEIEKSIRLNAANIKAFTSEVQKIQKQFYKNAGFDAKSSRGQKQSNAFFVTKSKNKRLSHK